jgi:hypothetical protein
VIEIEILRKVFEQEFRDEKILGNQRVIHQIISHMIHLFHVRVFRHQVQKREVEIVDHAVKQRRQTVDVLLIEQNVFLVDEVG